eukprot:jgi/Chlat1/871/Chrsp107S01318
MGLELPMGSPAQGSTSKQLSPEVAKDIAKRLAMTEEVAVWSGPGKGGLHFDQEEAERTADDATAAAGKEKYLVELVGRDPAVFLERYGRLLLPQELRAFTELEDNYEVSWHLRHLAPADSRARRTEVKNRRLAYLRRLEASGTYFAEEAMRERRPALYEQYIGQYQTPAERQRVATRAIGGRLSDFILRQQHEAQINARMREEQQRMDQATEEFESDSDEEAEASPSHQEASTATDQPATDSTLPTVSAEERLSMAEDFTSLMKQKFLAGDDMEFLNYRHIDDDATLDDDWLKDADRDAEDKYFDEDCL